jgi:hypothetical protein
VADGAFAASAAEAGDAAAAVLVCAAGRRPRFALLLPTGLPGFGAAAGVGFGAKKCFMVLHPCAVACSGVHGFKAGAMEDLENAALCRRFSVSGNALAVDAL